MNDAGSAVMRETIASAPKTKTGFMVVLSAPSGGGKTTILRHLLASGDPDFQYSVSATTRRPRNNEMHGRDYFFITPEEFRRCAATGEFIESANVHGNFYGTPRASVEKAMAQGKIVLLDLDVQGGLNVKRQMGERAILIFIQPPSLDALRERLSGRNTDKAEDIAARMAAARAELAQARHYDFVVVNNDLEQTVQQVREIINQYR